MKIVKNIFAFLLLVSLVVSCDPTEDRIYSFDEITAPSVTDAIVNITTDNTGTVTVIPSAEGATMYKVTFGDTESETPTEFGIQDAITHVYGEGSYTIGIVAVGLTGLSSTEFTKAIDVIFTPPANLSVTAENDMAVSKQVNVTGSADNATAIDYYFGEVVDEEPLTGEPGTAVSYIYENAGDYEITVVARNASSVTLDTSFTFTVTEIKGPQVAAPTPPGRVDTDVISIFSDAYTDVENTNFNPNWGQSTIVTTVEIDGNNTIQYSNLNYQGTQLEGSVDASGMEYLHIDIWTEDATEANIYPISPGPLEKAYSLPITSGTWVSYDIALTEFSDIVNMSEVFQFKFTGTTGSTVYIDNLYFYREGASTEPTLPLDFESATVNYVWTDFDGGATTLMDNPDATGVNTSSKVMQMIKNTGQSWGGSFITLEAPIDFSTNKTFKMKVWANKVGAKALLKVENASNGGIAFEKEATTTVANQWEELTFDYSTIDTGNEYQKVVIIFDLGTVGDGSADFTYYFDDIVLTN